MTEKETKKFGESVLNLTNRNILSVTGVEKIISVSESQINMLVSGSSLCILGAELTVQKLDVENGLLKVTGTVASLKYNEKKENLLKRLFK